MIRHPHEQKVELREKMRDGNGTVSVFTLWEPKTELKSPQRMFARMVLPPGASIGEHPHANEEEVYYVLSGEGETLLNGEWVAVRAGDSTLTGGGASHAIRNSGNTDLEILAIITCYA